MSFVDIAGIVRGASEGEGLGNKFLANIREADAIAQVVRGFADDDVVHVEGAVNPKNDLETINAELHARRPRRRSRRRSRATRRRSRASKLDPSVLETAVEARRMRCSAAMLLSASGIDLAPIKELGLLTAKPFIFVFNVDEAVLTDAARKAELEALVAPAKAVFLDAKIESELIDLDPEDAAELLASTGQDESGLDQLARIGFDTLGLQTYLTAGPKEARAWTIRKGWKAPQAAGVIHTDFEKGFIKAEVISFDDLVETGSVARGAREGQGPPRGQGLRHAGRRRRRVPLQCLTCSRPAPAAARPTPTSRARCWCARCADTSGRLRRSRLPEGATTVVKDAVGNPLADGDTVTIVKDLKVKGAGGGVVKVGTKVRGIRLIDDGVGDHDIDATVPGFGRMQLKSSVVKKVL